ncbi:hypothetical protein BKK51_12990 [Rodentibacter trehalosifermentans]|uniref:Uncharacterized protein n=1 Tax=Rodentibacter trehalosifermentans TaxID=1908263 RepID=A0A1V3ISX0_9PAST|nr:hypothetical protein [Rodentibacter trehalosifermentans]OOF42281.1 hypothetical protein BKK51_12990 [Rodentibacter trehalosifermentans]OOF45191.1 hypothetical protein BKK52_12835 [Rodentibacter trehalosifermentans]
MFLEKDYLMKLVFELKIENLFNKDYVRNVQKLTLNHNKNLGLKGKYGLYDSEKWWYNIENGILPSKVITGKIIRVYQAGQENNKKFNSFDLILDNGERWSSGIYSNNKSDFKLFEIGKKVSIFYVLEELKTGEVIDLVIEMAVEI